MYIYDGIQIFSAIHIQIYYNVHVYIKKYYRLLYDIDITVVFTCIISDSCNNGFIVSD